MAAPTPPPTKKATPDPLRVQRISDHQAAQSADAKATANPPSIAEQQSKDLKAKKAEDNPDQARIDAKSVTVDESETIAKTKKQPDPGALVATLTDAAPMDMNQDLPVSADELHPIIRQLQKLANLQEEEIKRQSGLYQKAAKELSVTANQRAQIASTRKSMESRTKRIMGHDLTGEVDVGDGHYQQTYRVFTPLGDLSRLKVVRSGMLATIRETYNDEKTTAYEVLDTTQIAVKECTICTLNPDYYELMGPNN